MKKLLFIFSLLATWLLVSNTYAQTVEEIEFTITNKEVVGASGSRPWLELSGKHDIYGKITICLDSYHGAYNDATLTDVKNIHILHDKVSKYFQNGQLIIRKGGVEYNVQGIKL